MLCLFSQYTSSLSTGWFPYTHSCHNIPHFRIERKKKKLAIENAHRVASWTKKIMVEKQMSVNEPLLAPEVRIEKVRTEKLYWKDITNSGDTISEYEFQEDPDWEFAREMLELGHVLGEGAFGKVIKGLAHCKLVVSDTMQMDGNAKEPAIVAVKMLKEGHTDGDMIDFVREMEVMKMIGKHVNIINLLGVCTQPIGQPLLVIVELAEHGNLRDFLRARRPELVQYLGRQGDRHVSLRDMLSFGWKVD